MSLVLCPRPWKVIRCIWKCVCVHVRGHASGKEARGDTKTDTLIFTSSLWLLGTSDSYFVI